MTKGYGKELRVLRNIQKTLQHGIPKWTEKHIKLFVEYCNLNNQRFVPYNSTSYDIDTMLIDLKCFQCECCGGANIR